MKEVYMYKRKAVGSHPIDFRCKNCSQDVYAMLSKESQ